MPAWYRIVSDRGVLRRAVLVGLGVGTVLAAVNQGPAILAGSLPPAALPAIAVGYLVPFFVSLLMSVVVVRLERRDRAAATQLLEREVEAINRFPGQNPHPVMRITESGRLTYANAASEPVRAALGVEVGDDLPAAAVEALRDAAAARPPEHIELSLDRHTFALLPVHVPELSVYNLYGTDITAAKVVERFPDRNPNPVLRITPAGVLWYGNDASMPVRRALEATIGEPLPRPVIDAIDEALADPASPGVEIAGGGRTYRLQPVAVPEFDFVNLYGMDVTAEKAIDKFPNENPNPVLRLTREGVMTYANPASELVRRALGAEVGGTLAPDMLARIVDATREDDAGFEVEADGRTYAIKAVRLYEFDSINLYGTDITAARQVAALSAANEALLLNILPQSIADRLRAGERVIADRFDDMAVLFADVVDFTALSSGLEPTDVVDLLNDIFSACDRLAEQFRLEKIKTVGDAYMVVGGLQTVYGHAQEEHATFARDVALMGLAIIDEADKVGRARGSPLQVRVGLHVGPAVAGVIGIRKFIYDVWGDTVNTASRMESTGVPGRIQVTRATYERLADEFEFERRGIVNVKGKGPIETWFLVGRRDVAGAAAAATRPARSTGRTDRRRPS